MWVFQKAGNSHVKLNIHSIKQIVNLRFVLQFSPTRSLSAKVRTEHAKSPFRGSKRLESLQRQSIWSADPKLEHETKEAE